MAIKKLNTTKAPALALTPTQFSQQHFDLFNNQLRLYFNQLDVFNNILVDPLGGGYLSMPHVAASDSTDQYATATNTPTIVKWDTLDSGVGFTLNLDNTATALQAGVYKIDYSLQYVNTANAIHNATVWLRINGVDLPGSASKFTLQARKSAGVYNFLVAYSSVVFTLNADDVVGLYWATDQAYNPVGPVDGIYMEYEAAQTSPFAHPTVPSAIGSITFVSRL